MNTRKHVRFFNFNKYGERKIGDCAIRAIVAGIGMDYDLVCKKLGASFKRGRGLIRNSGIELNDIKSKFRGFFDVIQDFEEDLAFTPPPEDIPASMRNAPDFIDPDEFDLANGISLPTGITLADFIDLYNSDHGLYLVSLVCNPNAANPVCRQSDAGHIVFVNCKDDPGYAVDTWDASEMIVDCFMRIVKRIPKDSPMHWKKEDYLRK